MDTYVYIVTKMQMLFLQDKDCGRKLTLIQSILAAVKLIVFHSFPSRIK
jgi:hypothetical protein